ncbi:MAG TPA: nitronate monooxygenase [Kineosporiaceae bacterium]|nr:nitronate monooxygenase [Kineosporiaceae bacterium]
MTLRTIQRRPVVIQGGMGVGISSWELANAVARTGQLGVVSGTALDTVLARKLQDGDPGGHVRRALRDFPLPEVADHVLDRFYRPQGRGGQPYTPAPRLGLRTSRAADELAVVGNFVEVWLAKEGHGGWVGINFLEKIQMATAAAAYGAMLAGVDAVLMGAGIPREIPQLLDALAEQRPGTLHVDVTGGEAVPLTFDPATLGGARLPALRRPMFLAIVSSHVLAQYLNREEGTRPDGFVVEGPSAGGHNAPPRGQLALDESGEPVYGPRDEANLAALARIGLPFWLAGGYGEPEKVRSALDAGAAGVQVGTLFALSRESGLSEPLREQLLHRLRGGELSVRTDPSASPTGFPFKVAQLPGTLAATDVYAARPRLCDLGYLRQPYLRASGGYGYRCPAEPVDVFVRKGGTAEEAEGAKCLCNALMADIELGQHRKDGYAEQPLVTLGSDLAGARRLDSEHWLHGGNAAGWSAADAVQWLLREVGAPAETPLPIGTDAPLQDSPATA